MNYEAKIQRELDRHNQQWCDARCPDVVKFGKQADKRIAEAEALLRDARENGVNNQAWHSKLNDYFRKKQ
jgi:hypothetical protein